MKSTKIIISVENLDWIALAGVGFVGGLAISAFLKGSGSSNFSNQRSSKRRNWEDEDQIRESEILQGVVHEIDRSSRNDKFHTLMGLAQLGWQALTAKPKESKTINASAEPNISRND